MSSEHSAREKYVNKQFVSWLAVMAPLFVICVLVLDALGLSTVWVFGAGVIFSEATDPLLEWFIEWWEASQEVDKA